MNANDDNDDEDYVPPSLIEPQQILGDDDTLEGDVDIDELNDLLIESKENRKNDNRNDNDSQEVDEDESNSEDEINGDIDNAVGPTRILAVRVESSFICVTVTNRVRNCMCRRGIR